VTGALEGRGLEGVCWLCCGGKELGYPWINGQRETADGEGDGMGLG
jgi:hypothetical protein